MEVGSSFKLRAATCTILAACSQPKKQSQVLEAAPPLNIGSTFQAELSVVKWLNGYLAASDSPSVLASEYVCIMQHLLGLGLV